MHRLRDGPRQGPFLEVSRVSVGRALSGQTAQAWREEGCPSDERAAARMVKSRRWTVAVPHGCALRDGSGLSCRGGCSVALLGAVDGRAPDTE